jgi:hypothetical protein
MYITNITKFCFIDLNLQVMLVVKPILNFRYEFCLSWTLDENQYIPIFFGGDMIDFTEITRAKVIFTTLAK